MMRTALNRKRKLATMSKRDPSNVTQGDTLVETKQSSTNTASTPQHATHRYHMTLIAVGLAMTAMSVFGLVTLIDVNSTLALLPQALIGGLGIALIILGDIGRRSGAGVQLVNTSFDLIARGHLAEAEKRLDATAKTNTTPLIRCVSDIQRGLIAMRRGDAKTGIEHLDRAIAIKPGFLYRNSVGVQKVNALGIRAFLRAATGDREGARADAKELQASPEALPQALARAALAEAICIEREGDRDALRKHLAENRDLLFDVTDRRERAIVRAFQRMLETTATSVYRKGAKLDLHGDEPPLVDWVAQLVPAAAPFVEAPASKDATKDLPASIASDQGKQAVTNSRKSAEKQLVGGSPFGRRVALAWVAVLGGVFFSIWKAFGPPNRDLTNPKIDPLAPWNPDAFLAALMLFLAVFLGGAIGRRVWLVLRARRATQELFAALNLSARGKIDEANEELTKLAGSRFALVKAQAHLALAYIAERRTDLATALDQCDKGIASLSQYVLRISASDILLPDLMSQRAFVLAAMDRYDEADAELASLPVAYPYRSRALLRVRLLSLVRRGDLAAAAKLASETQLDLPLTARDELLADGVCAAVKPESVSAAEMPRIRRELRTVESLRPWLMAVAPAALEAIERVTDEPLPRRDEQANEDAAEAEAHAEAEAAREEDSLRRAARSI
jgi:hypothetical protein